MPSLVIQTPLSPSIGVYRFVGVGAAATLVGFYADEEGRRTGASFTITVPGSGASVGLPSPNADAVGAVVMATSGTVAYSPGDGDGDLRAHAERYPSFGTADGCVRIGRVSG